MAEPVTLYKGTQTITTVAPSEARRLFSEGWNYEQRQRQEGQEEQEQGRPEVAVEKRTIYVGELGDVDKLLPPVEPDPQFTPKRRTKKA